MSSDNQPALTFRERLYYKSRPRNATFSEMVTDLVSVFLCATSVSSVSLWWIKVR